MKIMINPGHDSQIGANGWRVDSGAVNHEYGLCESDIVLEIGGKVADILKQEGHSVVLMQSDNLCGEDGYDYRYSVVGQCNLNKVDFVVSLHCNAADNIYATGVETLVYEFGTPAADLAQCIQDHLVAALDMMDRGLRERKRLAILKATYMPACLVELGFLTCDDDALLLKNEQDSFARAVADGILEYIDNYC